MIALKTWSVAQILTLASLAILGDGLEGLLNPRILFVLPFTAIGGLPALLLLAAWLQWLRKGWLPGHLAIMLSLVVFPAATACCSFGLAHMLGLGHREISGLATPPVVVAVLSVLLYSRAIIRSLPQQAVKGITHTSSYQNK